MLRRILYFGYYIKGLDWKKLRKFMGFVRQHHKVGLFSLWLDIIMSSMKYNISIMEYFNFRFYTLNSVERSAYAGTGYMYEYQLEMNPVPARLLFVDKIRFLKEYNQYVRHAHASLVELESVPSKADVLLRNASGKVILKNSKGQCGIGVAVVNSTDLSPRSLIQNLRDSGNDLAEEFVVQHDDLMRLSPSGLNTVRIITQLRNEDQVDILGARLRITINSLVDNLAAGNIAAPIDLETGVIDGPGVYSDVTKSDEYTHPVTGASIVGFQVPYWNETVEMIKAAALQNKSNRSIGWDIAITNIGPELIEGNHDWCKLLWQLPVKKGLKSTLEFYKRETDLL